MWNLLIAEDEKYLREKVTKNVDWEGHGYTVYVASDGEEALEIIRTQPIDILVTDIRMPGMDGLELTGEAKAINEDLKIIVISGHAEFELAQASIRLGVEDYLLKPFRTERLLEVVERTREKLDAEQKRREHAKSQEELARQSLEDRFNSVFGWLANPHAFSSEPLVPIHHRFADILKSGTVQELQDEIRLFHASMDLSRQDPDRLFILLNDIVISTLSTLKTLGFDLEQGMSLMNKHLPAKTQTKLSDLQQWVEDFLLDINELIESGQEGSMEQLVQNVKAYVEGHYRSGVTLNTMAAKVNMSPSQLSKLFHAYAGENFSDYVTGLKLQKAKELLKGTDNRVYEIADYLGFTDAYYFSSWFKRIAGCTPTEYRGG
ncbi:MAG: response regulator [Limnochordia bacterium]|jgi:two-component system response regulator YesN|nr:response regulator [Limnochordia bacterium]